jgi:hypothetical protein
LLCKYETENSEDVEGTSLGDRKKGLARLLGRRRIGIVLSDHPTEDGATIFRHACRMGLEGIQRGQVCREEHQAAGLMRLQIRKGWWCSVRCKRRAPPSSVEALPPSNQLPARTHVYTRKDFKERFMHEKDDRTVLTAIDARGARLGRPMLVVLIVSTLTVIGIFSLLYYGTYG